MKLIGRAREIAVLNRLYKSKRSEFLALYGRRRVGKTMMIKTVFEDKSDAVFFNVTGSKDGSFVEQTGHFIRRIAEVFFGGAPLAEVKDWNKVFALLTEAITKQPKQKKIVLFFDELPWLATRNSRLLQNLEYYWNQYWSADSRIKLIICGSSASWIIHKIIKSKGGLHNRITEKMLLEPFNLMETKAYLDDKKIKLDKKQVLMIYMVTGGVPYYLSKIKWKLSAMQIIEKLAFSKDAFFLDEFDHLFSSLFNDHDAHVEIVRTLANHRYGIAQKELLEQVGGAGGNSKKRLQELEEAGFIISFKPIYHRKKGIYYRLVDEYSYFYLKWIEPVKDALKRRALDQGDWQLIQSTPKWNSWLGYAFESVCYKHILQIKRALMLPPMSIPYTWRYSPRKGSKEQGAQIDLLFDRQDDAITLCEIKMTARPFKITKDYHELLQRRMQIFKEKTRTKKQLLLSFVSATGLHENAYSKDIVCNVVTLDDLFSMGNY